MRPIIITVFCVMVCYYAGLNDYALNFGYLKFKFDVGPEQYSRTNVANELGSIFTLFVVVPIMIRYFKLHETAVLAIISAVAAAAYAGCAFASDFWPGYIIAYFFTNIRGAHYSSGRALATKGKA